MSEELLNFIKSVQYEIENKSYSYVYFNPDTGKIEKVTNNLEENETLKYIKVLTLNIDEIFTGKKRIEDYKVVYDFQKDCYELVFLDDEVVVQHIGDKIYQIPKVNKTQIYSTDLTVRQDIREKFWHFFVSKDVKQIANKLFFSITAKNNPNILYRTFIVDTNTEEGCVSFPFVYDTEQNPKKISVYTNKILKTYAYEVLHD